MLISPPFLPPRPDTQTDDNAWLDDAMLGGAPGDGAYPLSFNLGWHGGMHLTAPLAANNQPERVRAIADGTVVYLRAPTPPNTDPNHPQNYRGGWTDNGCIVIRHVTEIGATAQSATPTRVVFFSIYMHLDEINVADVHLNQHIYRKTNIGRAGRIYGSTARKLHFEIVCDPTNLQPLIHRTSGDVVTNSDGRSDSVFGELYFHLPSTTQVYATRPPRNASTSTNGTALGEALFVGIRYATGDATVTTYRADGSILGNALSEADAEYNLYTDATDISRAYPASGRPAPSAVYELLRFGRVINTANETLTPADTPHWRHICTPTGEGWVNLNAADVHQFSDADFPQWRGWKLIDDDTDGNSQCNSATINAWLNANHSQQAPYEADPNSASTQDARSRLQQDETQRKLQRCICKFPTEWDAGKFEQRYGWLKAKTTENTNPLDAASYAKLKAHVEALAFWTQANLQVPQYDAQDNETRQTPLDAVHWHFHPREFIRQFRMCGWLSMGDIVRVIKGGTARPSLTKATVISRLTQASNRRPASIHVPLQKMMRKYGISAPLRTACLFSQLAEETGKLELMVEGGSDLYFDKYEPSTDQGRKLGNTAKGDGKRFKGRGVIQITGRTNYENYGKYRGDVTKFLTDASAATLASEAHLTCDASGFYWAWKQRYTINKKRKLTPFGKLGINYWADQGVTSQDIKQMTKCINSAAHHFTEVRWPCFVHAWHAVNDEAIAPNDFTPISS